MNILELDSYNLADAVKFNEKLNPRIWQGDKMKPQVRVKLLQIAEDFKQSLGLSDLEVKDITVSGSNAGYTYTPNSDIDLHLVVDLPQADSSEVYRELFDAKKFQYNETHNITIGGYDVELYVENANEPPVSQGMYSVVKDDWINIPLKKRSTVNDNAVKSKYDVMKHRIESAIASKNFKRLTNTAAKIKKMRQAGLDKHGELGPENLAYKMLRTQGTIKALYDARTAAQDKQLSLKEQPKPEYKKVYYGFTEDVGITPDGVSPETKMFLSETDDEQTVADFIKSTAEFLGIENLPTINLHSDPDWGEQNHSFGRYDPDTHELHVNLANRHIMDVLRTTAHELAHCRQHEIKELPLEAGETGSPWENEAHAVAGIVMRNYADQHPEMFQGVDLNENASGYIPKNKKEAKDPRYSMALTVDIKPGQVGKEANKLALQTDKQGKPALLMKTANMIGESRVSLFNWLKQHFPTWPDYVLKDFLYQQAKGIRDHAELEDFLKRNKQDFGQVKWRLENLPITLDIFTPKTQRMIRSRAGGTSNPFDVPKDAERHAQQSKMIQQQGVRTEPIIVAKLNNGYDLIEGWHRTIQHLKAYPDGYTGPAWVGYGATYTSVAEEKDSLAESLLGEFKLFEQDLFEVKMTSKNLAKLAKDIKGVKVGLEFEMIVPNATVEEEGDMEPDYDQDQRVRDIDDAVNFFDDGDYNSRNELRRLRENMESDFFDWQFEKIDELWNSNSGWDFFTNYLDREDPFDEEEAEEEARNELQAQYGDELDVEDFEKMLFELVDEKRNNYHQEQWDEQGRNYDNAREEFEEEQRDELTEEDWLDSQGIRYASDVESTFGHVTWPYYTSSSDDDETAIERIALDFMNGIGADSVAYSSSYHGRYKKWVGNGWVDIGSNKPDDCFAIEPDGSLEANDSDDAGLEFVSPPTPLEQVPDLMKRVQSWAADNGVYTGKHNKTSIHTNISVPGYDLDKLDYLKAALLLGDEYVLREFDRIGNSYAAPAIEKVKQLVQQKPEKAKELLDKMKSQLNAEASKLIHSGQTNKFTSINTKDNRVEFRSPGGDYLSIIADNPQKMIDTINRMVVTLDAAMDPNKYKEEYQKKLYKVLTGQGGGREAKSGLKKEMKASDKDLINIFSRYAAGELPRAALKSFVRQAQLERRGKKADAELASHNWAIRRRDSGDIVRTFQADDYTAAHEYLQQYKQKHNITDNSLTYGPYNPAEEKPAQQGGGPTLNGRPSNPDGGWVISPENDRSRVAYRFAAASFDDANTVRRQWAADNEGIWIVQRDDNRTLGQPSGQPAQQPRSSTQFGAATGAPNYAVVRDSDGTVVYRFYADDRSEALGLKHDFVQMQGWGQRDYSLRDESQAAAPQREYEIFADTDPFTVVRSFYAADDQAAQAILDRYRQDHPGTYYRAHRAPIPGSTLDLQRQRAAAAQQQQGNWGIWIQGNNRFANQPGEYPRGAEVPLYRFPSREAAEQWIEQQRAERPRMRTDIEVREIEPREPLPDLFPELPGTPAAQQGNAVTYEIYNRNSGAVIDTFTASNDQEALQKLEDFRDSGRHSFTPAQAQASFGVRRGPGVDNTAPQTPDQQQGGVVDVAGEQPATAPRTLTVPGQPQQQFTGEWKIVNPQGEEIYRFGGVGNAQSDANRVAMQWLQRNPRQMVAGVEVLPVMG